MNELIFSVSSLVLPTTFMNLAFSASAYLIDEFNVPSIVDFSFFSISPINFPWTSILAL
jgi:hypothetical protein